MTNKLYILFIAAVLIITGSVLYANLKSDPKNDQPTSLASPATEALIAGLEEKIKQDPQNIKAYISLASAYHQKVRETADVAYYQKIEELMQTGEKITPNNPEIFATRAAVALGRHHFQEALELGTKAVALNPREALYYGIMGDAHIELGNYEEAVTNFQQMIDLKPNLASYNRAAYARELHGDIPGAMELLKAAISAGSGFPENIAFSYVELGKLHLRKDLDAAETHFKQALQLAPNYSPALEGLGKVAFFRNDLAGAKDYFTQAFNLLPIAQYATLLGDVYQTEGNQTKADQQYYIAQVAFEKSKASGVNTDQEVAVFLADHDNKPEEALHLALEAYKERKSIFGADTLAWAYYKNKNYAEAEKYIKEAMRLGEHEPIILFHAGMIAKEQGKTAQAKNYFQKLITIAPNFSVQYKSIAEQTLQQL